MRKTRLLPALLLAALAPLAAPAQDEGAKPPKFDFEEFADAAREALDKFSEELIPYLEELGERMGEMSEYHPPEVLPNGDIIIRRKTPLPPPPPPEKAPEKAPKGDDDDVIEL